MGRFQAGRAGCEAALAACTSLAAAAPGADGAVAATAETRTSLGLREVGIFNENYGIVMGIRRFSWDFLGISWDILLTWGVQLRGY